MKHTPGPWRIRRGTAHLSCVEVEVQDGDSVATVYDGVMGIDNAEANARLIAAAPDLLEALKALEVLFSPCVRDSTQADWIDRARAAIKKAEEA